MHWAPAARRGRLGHRSSRDDTNGTRSRSRRVPHRRAPGHGRAGSRRRRVVRLDHHRGSGPGGGERRWAGLWATQHRGADRRCPRGGGPGWGCGHAARERPDRLRRCPYRGPGGRATAGFPGRRDRSAPGVPRRRGRARQRQGRRDGRRARGGDGMSPRETTAPNRADQLRRRVAEQNVAAILDATGAQLERDPNLSLVQIAKAAGVSRPTLYAHFPTREDLIEAAVRRALDETERDIDAASIDDGTPTEALERLITAGGGGLAPPLPIVPPAPP